MTAKTRPSGLRAEDRRVMQWYSDHTLADGWWTLSRYARRQYFVRQLYVKALGRVIANRMVRYPDTVIAASGDGEVELAFKANGPPYADYSPYATAEFCDWLRGGGLYAPGQPFAVDAYTNSARYRGDSSPAADTNGDGHTLNGDFGTPFTTWQMRYFDWDLADDPFADPRAIPASEYTAPERIRGPISAAIDSTPHVIRRHCRPGLRCGPRSASIWSRVITVILPNGLRRRRM